MTSKNSAAKKGGAFSLPGSTGSGKRMQRLRSGFTPLIFLGPAIILVLLFFFLPVILTVLISLTDMATSTFAGRWHFIGLGNYERMYISP